MICIQKHMALCTTLILCGTLFGCKEPTRPPQKPAAQVALPMETLTTTSSEVITEMNLSAEEALSESIAQESEILTIEMITPSALTTEEMDETSSNSLSSIETSPTDSNL